MTSRGKESKTASLGPYLQREQWIVNLGKDAAPGDETSLEILERRERVKFRLDHEDRPWISIPAEQLHVLSILSDTFGREDRFDEASHCRLQVAAIESLTKAVEENHMMGKPLFYDFCHHFIKNEYPRMRHYEEYCILHGVSRMGVRDPRMSVLLSLAQFWKMYENTILSLSKRVGRRDPFSRLVFDDVQLPPDPMRGNGDADENGDSGISGGDASVSLSQKSEDNSPARGQKERGHENASPLAAAAAVATAATTTTTTTTTGVAALSPSSSAVKDMGGIDGLEKIGIGTASGHNSERGEDEQMNDRQVFFLRRWFANAMKFIKALIILVPCMNKLLHIFGLQERDPNAVVSLSSVEKTMQKEHKRRRKSTRKVLGLHIAQEGEMEDYGDIDDGREQNYVVEALSWHKRAGKKWNSLAKKLVKLSERWLPIIALGPVVIMVMLRVSLENQALMPYAPAEYIARVHLMLQVFSFFDLGIFSLLILFYYLGAQQKKFRGFRKNDRLMRLRPLTVLALSCMFGITAMRFSGDAGNADSSINVLHLTTWAIVLHLFMLVLLRSQLDAFLKRIKYEQTGKTPWIGLVRLLSTDKWIETGLKHCVKTTYRGGIQGKGLAVMQRHAERHQRKITKLTAATSQKGSSISKKMRYRVSYMKLKRKRYNKAIKSMKVEIAMHMMDVMYAGMENARKVALPTEICMLAVHYVSYYNLHEYVKNNEELRRTFVKLRDMDKVWHYLLHAFELARAENDLKSENWIRDQIETFLVTDKLKWDSNMLVFKTKKRLRLLRKRTKVQLERLKNIGQISLFHRHHEHHHQASSVAAALLAEGKAGGAIETRSPLSAMGMEKGTGQALAAAGGEAKTDTAKQQEEENEEELLVVDIRATEDTASHYVKRMKDSRFLEIIANGVLGRKTLIEEVVSLQGMQSELNCRLSASNMATQKWRHEDWACAATAANAMNILHRGWTQTPVRDPKTGKDKKRRNGKIEYIYYNRRLNAATQKSLANGLSRKTLPDWLLKTGGICPHGNLWTAKSIFEAFFEILHRLEPNKRHSKTSQPFLVKEEHVSKIITRERAWVQSEQQLSEALTQYQRIETLRMKKNFQVIAERLKMAPRVQGGEDDEGSEGSEEESGSGEEGGAEAD
jgi:hypothetical protein